jgi:hypothetical protein
MSFSQEQKARLQRTLKDHAALDGAELHDILWACQIATAHEVGEKQLEALVEFLEAGQVLRLEGFPARGQSKEVRTVRELAEVVKRIDPAIDVMKLRR